MGKKAEQREARLQAALDRAAAVKQAAATDPLLLDWLRESAQKNPAALAQAAKMARAKSQQPSSPDYQQALVAMGGLEALGLA